jgi:hypothetical protein
MLWVQRMDASGTMAAALLKTPIGLCAVLLAR